MQQELAGLKHSRGHANLGKSFEAMLERAHALYAHAGSASVDRNPNEWQPASEGRAMTFPPAMRARTGTGRWIVMARSNIDYSGNVRGGRAVAFDAKETAKKSIPLDSFTPHQVERLCAKERAGALAGFLVHFSESGEVYWVRASQVRGSQDLVRFAKKGRGKEPKSLSLAWLAEYGVLVCRLKPGDQMVDWLPVLEKLA